MSLEFAIIPITDSFISTAYDIQTKLKNNVNLDLTITIDTNYTTQINSRINKWKKQGYDVVTIDHNYNESKSIIVIFSDKGSRSQVMEVDEFVELVTSYEYEEDNTEIDTKTSDDNQNDGCTIM